MRVRALKAGLPAGRSRRGSGCHWHPFTTASPLRYPDTAGRSGGYRGFAPAPLQRKPTDKPKFVKYTHLPQTKRRPCASRWAIPMAVTFFSPSECRTHAAKGVPAGRGCAGRRSSWRVPSFLSTCSSRARSLSVYAPLKKSEPNFGGFIDFPSILCYSIINLSRKEHDYANHQKRRGHFAPSDRRI